MTGFAASPVVWQSFLGADAADPLWDGLRSVRYVTLSGGDLPAHDIQRLVGALAPCRLFKTYGLTEMFRIASLRPEELDGMLRASGVRIRASGWR